MTMLDTSEIETIQRRERQKDHELERMQLENERLASHIEGCHRALAKAHVTIREMVHGKAGDALIELVTGWPPREGNEILYAEPGSIIHEGGWIIKPRRS